MKHYTYLIEEDDKKDFDNKIFLLHVYDSISDSKREQLISLFESLKKLLNDNNV